MRNATSLAIFILAIGLVSSASASVGTLTTQALGHAALTASGGAAEGLAPATHKELKGLLETIVDAELSGTAAEPASANAIQRFQALANTPEVKAYLVAHHHHEGDLQVTGDLDDATQHLVWALSPDEHWSVVSQFVPRALRDNIRKMFGASWIDGNRNFYVSHVFLALLACFIIFGMVFSARRRLRDEQAALLPPTRWGAFAFFDVIIEWLLGTMESMMTREEALRFLPIVTALFLFILVSNLMALIPGLLPATDSLNTTAALAIPVFLYYNYHGIRKQGIVAYLKHLMGPMIWLAPLMFPIEVIGHLVRPVSLALRLVGNMFGDHTVLSIFLGFHLIFVPMPIMLLGLIVCVVQALVFTLLTIVYLGMAVADHHDDGHGEAHAHA